MKCSACGQVGHMKTNKNCPKYKAPASVAPLAEQVPAVAVTPAMTEEQQAAEESELVHDDFQVKVEGTKISFGKAFVDRLVVAFCNTDFWTKLDIPVLCAM